MAQDAKRRHLAAKRQIELHLGRSGFSKSLPLKIRHARRGEAEGAQIGAYKLQGITLGKFVAQAAQGNAVFIAAFTFTFLLSVATNPSSFVMVTSTRPFGSILVPSAPRI